MKLGTPRFEESIEDLTNQEPDADKAEDSSDEESEEPGRGKGGKSG